MDCSTVRFTVDKYPHISGHVQFTAVVGGSTVLYNYTSKKCRVVRFVETG